MNIAVQLPGVRLGLVEAEGAILAPPSAQFVHEINETCAALRQRFTLDSLAQADSIVTVRAMFRAWGLDPSKYRPSSEALLRRVVQGKGLYSVSNVVDITNLGSIETAWPYGVYNRAKIAGEICLRLGSLDEKYEGIGRRMWHLGGRPVLADDLGPFGSPISDSTRTQIAEGASEVLTVIYAPAEASAAEINSAAQKQAERLQAHASAGILRVGVLDGAHSASSDDRR